MGWLEECDWKCSTGRAATRELVIPQRALSHLSSRLAGGVYLPHVLAAQGPTPMSLLKPINHEQIDDNRSSTNVVK